MDLDEFQEKAVEIVKKIDLKQKGKHDMETTAIHLAEEFGEINRQLFNQKIGRDELNRENLAEEIADCMILLTHLAHNFDINVKKSILAKLEKLKNKHKL